MLLLGVDGVGGWRGRNPAIEQRGRGGGGEEGNKTKERKDHLLLVVLVLVQSRQFEVYVNALKN